MQSELMNDSLRQISNLILAPLMWFCSSLSFIIEGANSPGDMSDSNANLLTPLGAAFSIWLPIFVLCIAYGFVQALPRNRERGVFRRVGWWSAAGFAGVCMWGLVNAFAPMQPFNWALLSTAIIFVPTMLLLVKAMLIVTAEKENLKGFEKIVTWLGLSLIAGWCSIAVFVNWTAQTVALMTSFGLGAQLAHTIILALALMWGVFIILKSAGNRAYAFPIIWGLVFIIIRRLMSAPSYNVITIGAVIGIVVLIVACLVKPKTRQTI
jgi:hypothetical protein